MASTTSSTTNDTSILTLPLDLLTNITNKLEPHDEKALKLTCKRMNFLIARPLHHHLPADHPALQRLQNRPDHEHGPTDEEHGGGGHSFLTVGVSRDLIPRDGRATPIPQSPLPFKAATTLQELELENKEVEEREEERGMELSDDDEGSVATTSHSTSQHHHNNDNSRMPKKYKIKKNILHWTAELESAPSSPGATRSSSTAPTGGFVHSPRASSPAPALPSFTLSIQ